MCRRSIADGLGATLSEVYGVATFYSQFSLEPKGQYVVGVCLGTACYVKGSQKVLDKLSEELDVHGGHRPPRTAASPLNATRCLGACGLAPVMMINDEVYGRLTPDDMPGILAKYRACKQPCGICRCMYWIWYRTASAAGASLVEIFLTLEDERLADAGLFGTTERA